APLPVPDTSLFRSPAWTFVHDSCARVRPGQPWQSGHRATTPACGGESATEASQGSVEKIRPAAEPEERKDMPDYVLAIDQGTTSTRAIIFDHAGQIVESGQIEHEQILPKAGWVEHDPLEIWRNTREVVGLALARAPLSKADIAAVGITNQRETAVVWDKNTGEPVYNAIVWQDTRTQKIVDELGGADGPDKYKAKVGLPLATYFSGPKIRWIL